MERFKAAGGKVLAVLGNKAVLAGLFAALGAAGVAVSPAMQDAVATILVALASLVGAG